MPHPGWAEVLEKEMEILQDEDGHHLPLSPSLSLNRSFHLECESSARGSFVCTNCNNRWTSGHVAIVFRFGFDVDRSEFYVSIDEFGQSCKKCIRHPSDSDFEKPNLFPDSLERPAKFLVQKILKKFYGQDKNDDRERDRQPVSHIDLFHCLLPKNIILQKF